MRSAHSFHLLTAILIISALVLPFFAASASFASTSPASNKMTDGGLIITQPLNGTRLNVNSVTVKWSFHSPTPERFTFEISIDGGPLIVNWSSDSLALKGLEDGWHLVQVQALGELGTLHQAQVRFFIDTVPPTIISRSPTGEMVPANAEIMISFSEEMEQSSVIVEGVEGSVTWGVRGLVLSPYEPLTPGKVYFVSVSGKDLAGNDLVEEGWSFRVTDEGTIIGVLRDERNRSLSGATVKLLSAGEEVANTTTDAWGSFSLTAPQGRYELEISGKGILTVRMNVTLTPSSTLDLGFIEAQRVKVDPVVVWALVMMAIVLGSILLILVGMRRESLRRR
ncbi:MAG: Ig-like domain-containing protein [Methanomassiliicoccales archaeon]